VHLFYDSYSSTHLQFWSQATRNTSKFDEHWFKQKCANQPDDILRTKGKTIPVTGPCGPHDFEKSRLPRFLGSLPTDDGDVRLARLPAALYPRKTPSTQLR
jgi:hypothetical protein